MQRTARTTIRFQEHDREAFGKFCVALTEEGVSFTHTGFHTVVVHAKPSELPPCSKELLAQSKADLSPREAQRPGSVAREAVNAALWKIAKNL